MSALVFLDTETTGLALDDDIWEFGGIRREEDGTETELHMFIEHDRRKCAELPSEFYRDHANRYLDHNAYTRVRAARQIAGFIGWDKPHVVGAVPNFDTERIARLLVEFDLSQRWHYHLIDVENLAVGYLAGERAGANMRPGTDLQPPWNSDDLATAVGVTIDERERHTAMGDARWAMRIYDAVMGGAR